MELSNLVSHFCFSRAEPVQMVHDDCARDSTGWETFKNAAALLVEQTVENGTSYLMMESVCKRKALVSWPLFSFSLL
jgi:hypothetical protein